MKIPATWTESELITSSSSSCDLTSSQLYYPQQPQQYVPQHRAAVVVPPSTPINKKAKRSVHFAPTMTVATIPNRDSLSPEEKESMWFQGRDYEEFRENSYMTLGLYRAGLLTEEKDHTLRGLEGRLSEVAREREWTRYYATKAVLDEQYKQYRLGYYSPQAIADSYHAVAWNSQYAAYHQAMIYEQQELQETSTVAPVCRKSDAKNLLRKVIDIERTDETTSATFMNTTCAMQMDDQADFDINSFFQEMTISAQ